MAIRRKTEEELELERREEWELIEYSSAQEAAKRDHELRIAQLKYRTQPRHKAVARVFVAFAKAMALPVTVVCITILVLKDREVPKSLIDFLTL